MIIIMIIIIIIIIIIILILIIIIFAVSLQRSLHYKYKIILKSLLRSDISTEWTRGLNLTYVRLS